MMRQRTLSYPHKCLSWQLIKSAWHRNLSVCLLQRSITIGLNKHLFVYLVLELAKLMYSKWWGTCAKCDYALFMCIRRLGPYTCASWMSAIISWDNERQNSCWHLQNSGCNSSVQAQAKSNNQDNTLSPLKTNLDCCSGSVQIYLLSLCPDVL